MINHPSFQPWEYHNPTDLALQAAANRTQACIDELIRALNHLEEQDPWDCDTPMAEMMGG